MIDEIHRALEEIALKKTIPNLGCFRETLRQILGKLGDLVGTSGFFIAAVSDESFRIVELLSKDKSLFEGAAWHMLDWMDAGLFGGRMPLVISDTSENPLAGVLVEQGVGSYLSVPIRLSDESLYGALCTSHSTSYDFSETEIRAMELVADILAYVVELEFAAVRDPLTGAYNRLFLQRHGPALQQEFGDSFALVYVDLDGFKTVNDRYGHDCGDTVLGLTVQRLRQRVRNGDFVVRVGGDEFVVILANVAGSPRSIRGATARLQEALDADYLVEPYRLRVRASLGVSFYPSDGRDFEALMQAADREMYQMKRRRGDGSRETNDIVDASRGTGLEATHAGDKDRQVGSAGVPAYEPRRRRMEFISPEKRNE